jgi:hypothetical protein
MPGLEACYHTGGLPLGRGCLRTFGPLAVYITPFCGIVNRYSDWVHTAQAVQAALPNRHVRSFSFGVYIVGCAVPSLQVGTLPIRVCI